MSLPINHNGEEQYEDIQKQFVSSVTSQLSDLKDEITERNQKIEERDQFIYGDLLEKNLRIPLGHDRTTVNWLRRTVEIHKTQFMGRPFQVISTYDTKDLDSAADQDDKQRLQIENKKQNEYAELRKGVIDAIIRDNGGHSLYMEGAESASAIGDFIIKAWYDKDEKKYVTSPIEAVENCYALWSKDDFREFDAFAYAYQISKLQTIEQYGVPETVATSKMGEPLTALGDTTNASTESGRSMVTILEITGKYEGWGTEKGKIKKVSVGNENEFNAVIVGNCVYSIIDDPAKLPKHYIFPNKKQRRRAWGVSDVSEAAININATYIETLSDWRTIAAKVNFPKYKGFNFGPDTQIPKPKSRQIQIIPLAEGQDIAPLQQGDANAVDFQQQMNELKEQFVRETGISRVLFDDPSVTLNSNQALLTSMKPTSDIAETKKQLWGPILQKMFTDAIETIAAYDSTVKELAEDNWELKIQWPSVMQKEDPAYQQMLLNRFNAKTMSLKSYLEAQGETKEEIDRIREEMTDPVTAAILGNQVPLLAQQTISPVDPNATKEPDIRHNVSWRAEMTPQQEANLASTIPGFQDGPFGMSMGPQGTNGAIAQSNVDNAGFLNGDPRKGGTPIDKDAQGNPIADPAQKQNKESVNSNGGTNTPAQVATTSQNQPGTGVASQPGTGATSTSPQGALDQQDQQQGA